MRECEQFEEIIETRWNGNVSDFRSRLEKMDKKKLARFVIYASAYEDIFFSIQKWAEQ